jgi:Family of unknown function (DUF6422)
VVNDDELTEEQAGALYKAALHVNNARKEAAEMLRGSGIDPRDSGLLGLCSMLVWRPLPSQSVRLHAGHALNDPTLGQADHHHVQPPGICPHLVVSGGSLSDS